MFLKYSFYWSYELNMFYLLVNCFTLVTLVFSPPLWKINQSYMQWFIFQLPILFHLHICLSSWWGHIFFFFTDRLRWDWQCAFCEIDIFLVYTLKLSPSECYFFNFILGSSNWPTVLRVPAFFPIPWVLC